MVDAENEVLMEGVRYDKWKWLRWKMGYQRVEREM